MLRASGATLDAMRASDDGVAVAMKSLDAAGQDRFDGWLLESTPVPHDARDCRAFVFTSDRDGERLGIALDLGHVPASLAPVFRHLDMLVLESNYDAGLLAAGPYPRSLKQRIGGALGHLSNGTAAAFAATCAHPGLRAVLLAHLSETNNTPHHAISRTRDALRRAGWRGDAVYAAHQVNACGPHGAQTLPGQNAVRQLSFGF
jgi:phosphoribosyl 1,2-cyclic phosphodiesterase